MPTQHIRFAKLIATPHETSWSQAYNAGGLYLVFSLSKDKAKAETTLNALGKDIINNIEAEFFTLEEKTLESIGNAIVAALAEIDPDITLNLCLAYNKDTVLYIFLYGSGKIIMQRQGHTGVLLQQPTSTRELKRASGRLQDNDTILLATHAFAKHFTPEHIESALSHDDPEKAVEGLLPLLETTENGEVASLFLVYKSPQESGTEERATNEPPILPSLPDEEEPEPVSKQPISEEELTQRPEQALPEPETIQQPQQPQDDEEAPLPSRRTSRPSPASSLVTLPNKIVGTLGLKRLAFLAIALVLLIILGKSALTAVHKKTTQKESALFQSIYDPAKKAYDEGVGLENLNKSLAQDDFTKAKQILDGAQGKFSPDSPEGKQIADLQKQVDGKVSGTSDAHQVDAKEVSSGSDLLAAAQKTNGVLGVAKDGTSIYTLTAKAVTKDAASIITNNSDWSNAEGIAVYTGNVYILDRKNGVLKYVAGSGGFGKSNYFSSGAPDLSKATSIAIDSSVWITTSDGQVMKFTRGTSDNLSLSGIPTPLSRPVAVNTNADMQNTYILDAGTNRIVKINKDGAFQAEFNNAVLGKATMMDIDEKNNTAYVFSDGKIYQLSLK